jgi:hypothetical protein
MLSGQAATVDLLEKTRHRGHNFTILTKPVHPTDNKTLHPGTVSVTAIANSTPVISGITTSEIRRSGWTTRASSRALSPS